MPVSKQIDQFLTLHSFQAYQRLKNNSFLPCASLNVDFASAATNLPIFQFIRKNSVS